MNKQMFKKVYDSLKEAEIDFSYDNESLTIVFYGAKLFSRNQTDTLKEQKPRPFNLIKYKKLWFERIQELHKLLHQHKPYLPDFNNKKLRLYLYRQIDKSQRQKLYDEDNLTTSFKYFIDGLRQTDEYGWKIINDDNQTIINECVPFQVKSNEPIIAIKILIGSNKPIINNFDEFKELK